MAEALTDHEKFLRRIEGLALATLPIKELSLVASPPAHHDGVMVALVPDDPEQLAVDNEEALPADDLHVTLCFLGKIQDLSNADQTKILSKTRSVCEAVGSPFTTNTDGVVVMGKNDDGVPATALLIQSDEIVELYEALADALDYESKYPTFIPHMTTGYGIPVEDVESSVGQPITFSKAIVKFGDAVHTIPLVAALTAAPRTANVIDRVIDSLGRLWDEALHPRDNEGKFIKKNGAVTGKLAVPTRDRKSVNMVDADRASVIGFHTFGDEVWVLAEIKDKDGKTAQGFARATDVRAVAPVKARLDALYPIDSRGDEFINASLERKRQLDLILGHIFEEYGDDDDDERAQEFLGTLGLTDRDLDYLFSGDDIDYLGGLRQPDAPLTDDEMDEAEDIIEDARTVKTLRERVHGLKQDLDAGRTVDEEDADVEPFDGPTVQRGVTMSLSDDEMAEVRRLLKLPTTTDEIGQEFNIGPMLVDIAKRHDKGIGSNWTTKPEMAETATMINRPENGGLPVIFTAKIRNGDVETRPEMMRDMHGDTEGEVRLRPGSDVEIVDVKIKDGPKWQSVWEEDQATQDIQSVSDLMNKYEALGVDSFLSEKDDRITLSKVVASERSQGTGSAFMQDLTDYADSTGKRIDLSPSSDFGGSKSRLVDFYKRFGFVENKGKNKDSEVSETMYRLPESAPEPDVQDLEPHVPPRQKLLEANPPDEAAVEALEGGADPLEVPTDNLLGAMRESGRYETFTTDADTGSTPISWMVDLNDRTDTTARLVGTDKTTTGRTYFVKESVSGAEFGNTDIVNEVVTSLIVEQVREAAGDNPSLLAQPKSRFGDNPEWDGTNPPPKFGEFHQPGHVVGEHAAYSVSPDWVMSDMSTEQVRFRPKTRGLDDLAKEEQVKSFKETMGDLYGNDLAKMVLQDFVILNGDRNPGNAFLAVAPGETESAVIPIDHGYAFDQPLREDAPEPILDAESTFEWFMNYHLTKEWMSYILGGLAVGNNVSESTLRQILEDFVDGYGHLDADKVLDDFRAMPGVTDKQIKRVEDSLALVVDRIQWMGDNMEAVLRKFTERAAS